MRSPAFPRRAYAVLANLSTGYSPSLGRFRSIAHPFAARQHVLLRLLPLDLHVLGTPPAFNLSQDQTLHLKIFRTSNQRVSIRPIAGLFGYSVNASKGRIDASPHTNYLQIFRQHYGRLGRRRGRNYRPEPHSVNLNIKRLHTYPPPREPQGPSVREGAHYRERIRPVNALSYSEPELA